jgi:hypothetical protein
MSGELEISPIIGVVDIPPTKSKKTHYNLESVRELFQNEDCEVISTSYRDVLSVIEYTYNDVQYKVQFYRWLKGARPHLPTVQKERCRRCKYSREIIQKMFEEDGVELSMPDDWEYSRNNETIAYTFDGKTFTTTINRYVNFHHRAHLKKPKSKQVVECK